MQQHKALPVIASVGLACTLGLSSCSDNSTPSWLSSLWGSSDEAPAAEEAPAPAPAAEQPAAPTAELQQELLDYMIFSVGEAVRKQAAQPMWRDEVRDMRNRIEAYLSDLKERGQNSVNTVRLSLFLADTTRDLAAYDKALSLYTATLADLEALPEAERNSLTGRRINSAIENGTGSCLLAQRKPADALPHYEKALEIDLSLFEELAPADEAPLPPGDNISPDLERAAEDVLSSYRCLGECQFLADDPEEARDTYKKGQALVVRMKHLKPGMSLQYIRLLSALGNLESRCGEPRRALAAWMSAGNLAQRLRQVAPSPAIQAQTVRFLRELETSVKAVSQELKAQEAEQTEPSAPQQ